MQQKKNIDRKKNNKDKIEKKRRAKTSKPKKKKKESRGKRVIIEKSSSIKGKRTPKDKKQSIDNLLGKMTMVISHDHFHRAIYGGSYTEILKVLCTKNNIPYVSPLEENSDSNLIIQKLSEQFQKFQGIVSSETENEISNSEDEESIYQTESENEERSMDED